MTRAELLVKQSAAVLCGVSSRTLERMAAAGIGPPRIRVNARWMYPREGLMEWINRSEVRQDATDRDNMRHDARVA